MIQLGRNAPCYCGSGKKYKKCCLDKDEGNTLSQNSVGGGQIVTKISPDLAKNFKPGMDFPQELLDNFYDAYESGANDENNNPLLFPNNEEMLQMHEEFEKFIGGEEFSSIDDLNKKMQEFHAISNQTGLDDFLGLSPDQMFRFQQYIIFDKKSGLEFNYNIDHQLIKNTLFVKLTEFILKYIYDAGKVKATAVKKSFPRKLAREFRELYIADNKDQDIIRMIYKVQSESDVPYLFLLRMLLKDCGLIKFQKGFFSLTKKGAKLAENGISVKDFSEMLIYYITQINWGYSDGYPDIFEIQYHAYFLFYIIHKKADEFISSSEVGKAMFKAFPMLNPKVESQYFKKDTVDIISAICSLRFVDRFCSLFGLLELEKRKDKDQIYMSETFCKKTELFKKLFIWSV